MHSKDFHAQHEDTTQAKSKKGKSLQASRMALYPKSLHSSRPRSTMAPRSSPSFRRSSRSD